ncbi:antioxidant 1 copper chaperone [Megachile rotundata]|uniref:antioxidant 1 copper chaperone n=1 Tax=Megachile rotundata TaxID=143995 RepID=UPI003FD0B549
MASQVYEFGVEMTCQGCANAVTNVLNKKEGVNDIQVDLDTKKIFVTSTLSSDEILQTIKKSGKACQFLGVKK